MEDRIREAYESLSPDSDTKLRMRSKILSAIPDYNAVPVKRKIRWQPLAVSAVALIIIIGGTLAIRGASGRKSESAELSSAAAKTTAPMTAPAYSAPEYSAFDAETGAGSEVGTQMPFIGNDSAASSDTFETLTTPAVSDATETSEAKAQDDTPYAAAPAEPIERQDQSDEILSDSLSMMTEPSAPDTTGGGAYSSIPDAAGESQPAAAADANEAPQSDIDIARPSFAIPAMEAFYKWCEHSTLTVDSLSHYADLILTAEFTDQERLDIESAFNEWAVSRELTPLFMSYDELVENGYITGEIPRFEEGAYFVITIDDITNSSATVRVFMWYGYLGSSGVDYPLTLVDGDWVLGEPIYSPVS